MLRRVATVERMRAPPHPEAASRAPLRLRGRRPWYARWWVWTLAVLLLVTALFLFAPRTPRTSGEDEGILRRLIHRIGGGRGQKPE